MFADPLALMAFFIMRMIVLTIHWSDPENRDLAIEGWMPVRHVAGHGMCRPRFSEKRWNSHPMHG
jgi:hypothetical protein